MLASATVAIAAGFAAIAHLGDHGPLDGGVEIGIIEHDEGGVAAQFHRAGNDRVGRLMQQAAPHFGRTGERELAHPAVMQHGAYHRP